ncbi:MAG: heme-binding protein [Nitrospirota bacterium]
MIATRFRLLLVSLLVVWGQGCVTDTGPNPSPQLCNGMGAQLSPSEVSDIVLKAAASLDSATMTVAVVDRSGNILAIFRKPGADSSNDNLAVSLARTGAFFSNNQAPLSSRTVRSISGIHFPAGVPLTANAALYGIENTNRGCELNVTFNEGKAIPPSKSVSGGDCNSTDRSGCGLGITTGKLDLKDSDPNAVNPGGIPIFRGCTVVGGIGVAGVPREHSEFAALSGTAGFPPSIAAPAVVFVEGISLPFVKQTTQPVGTTIGSVAGSFIVGPIAGLAAPDGYLVGPNAGSSLTKDEVKIIVEQSIETANRTRAAIRLPIGLRTRMVISVSDLDGTILALFRMTDSTVFSIDVAVAKSRNVVYFSGSDPDVALDLLEVPIKTAVTNRTISFGGQPLYPPGIDGSGFGPFMGLFLRDSKTACSQGSQSPNLNQNGIVFFPGSTPLYKNGVLSGGLGVSGDGVEQDDYVTAGGAAGFAPADSIRADQLFLRDIRLPFFKFPRNPEA